MEANLWMEVIGDSTPTSSKQQYLPKIWKRYVDVGFVLIKKNSVSAFHGMTLRFLLPLKLRTVPKLPF